MSSLIPHIEYLLQRHDCLILPGIGAFVVEHVSARIIPSEGIILPPHRNISFNGLICHDDGMLATSVSRAEGIKFEEARAVVTSELQSLRRSLQRDGEYSLGKIGSLLIGEEDTVSFRPYAAPTLEMAELGLCSAPLRSPVDTTPEEETIDSIGDTENTDTADTLIDCRRFSDKNYYIAINKVFAKCAASVFALVCVALAFVIPVTDSSTSIPVTASLNPIESISHPQPASAPDMEAQDFIRDTKDTDSSVDNENTMQDATSDADSDYYLIVATFNTREEALRFIETRSGGSYTLSPIKGRNVWRVSAGRGNKAALQALLNSAEFRAAFNESWIWSSH